MNGAFFSSSQGKFSTNSVNHRGWAWMSLCLALAAHAVERPGSHCGIVLPWTAGAGGLLSPFVAGQFDLSAVVFSSRLSRLRRARFGFCGGLYGLAQNIDLHDHRAWRCNGADSVFAAVGNAVIVRADRAVSDLRPDSDGDWRSDLSPMRLGFRLGGQRDSRAD